MTPQRMRFVFNFMIASIFSLICLGGAVRAMNAGLACPDWPLCFGQYIPDYHPQVYLEFIHRALAGIEALVCAYVSYFIYKSNLPKILKYTISLSLVILVIQIIMGGLTVLKLLHSGTVVAHLGLGSAFFLSLVWIRFAIAEKLIACPDYANRWRWVYVLVFVALFTQVLLGGAVAANYAGLACRDFPLCNGQWFPALDGIVGIQVIHRFGAYTVFAICLLTYIFISKKLGDHEIRIRHRQLISLILMQVLVGVANIKYEIPALITVIHLGLAMLILACALRMCFICFYKINQPSK